MPPERKKMRKSSNKQQRANEELVKKTLNNNYYSFKELYEAFYPKHFWENVNSSWQKEFDDFFVSFKKEREFFKNNYKSILSDAVNYQISKKQLEENCLKNEPIFERKVFIKNETIMTVYFTCQKNKTVGIFQKVKFFCPFGIEWNQKALLKSSSVIGCFCIKNSKFKNF